jgi:hypothetical protein
MSLNFVSIIILVIFLSFSNSFFVHAVDRTCACKQIYKFDSQTLSAPTKSQRVPDARDLCDFNCVDECSRQIRKDVGGDESVITSNGLEKMCSDVSSNKSLFKDGISLVNSWELVDCTKNELVLRDNVCCRMCTCRLSYLERDSLTEVSLADRSDSIFMKHGMKRAYECNRLDHHRECEADCRLEIVKLIGYDKINSMDIDVYDTFAAPNSNRTYSNQMCKLINKRVPSPGMQVMARVETGPRNLSWHKDISLGNVCCERVCTCDILYKHVNRALNKVEFQINVEDKMPQRPVSYYCDQELTECVDDCRQAAGVHLKSDLLRDTRISPLDMEIFSNFTAARRACVLLNRATKDSEGINVFLKYSTRLDHELNANVYPYAQELFLGNLCCDPLYFDISLFPFNKCKMWNLDDIPFNLEDLF